MAEGESKYHALESLLAKAPIITVPTITFEGGANGAPHPEASAYVGKFSGRCEHRVIKGGIGHNLPQEVPHAFAAAVAELTHLGIVSAEKEQLRARQGPSLPQGFRVARSADVPCPVPSDAFERAEVRRCIPPPCGLVRLTWAPLD